MATEKEFEELKSKVVRLTLINEISKSFSATLNYKELISSVFSKIVEAVDAEAGSFWLVDKNENVCKLAEGPVKKDLIGMRFPSGKGVVGACIESRKPSIVFDTSKDKRFSSDTDSKTHFQTRSMMCVPLICQNEVLGALQIINKKDPKARFGEADFEVLNNLASSAAVAMNNARLYEAEKKVQDLQAILELSSKITGTLDIDSVLLAVVNNTSRVIKYKRGIIALIEGDKIAIGAVSDIEKVDQNSEENILLKEYFLKFSSQTPMLYCEDIRQGSEEFPDVLKKYLALHPDICSFWIVTLKDGEGVVGTLMYEAVEPSFIAKRQLDLIQIFANEATVAIRNSLLYSHTPMMKLLGQMEGNKWTMIKNMMLSTPKRRLVSCIILGVLVLFFAIPLPHNVIGDCEVIPYKKIPVYVLEGGQIELIPENIRIGNNVEAGQLLACLDSRDATSALLKVEKDLDGLKKDIIVLRDAGKLPELYAKNLKKEQLELDLAKTKRALANIEIRASSRGILLTPDMDEKQGESVSKGDVLCEVAHEGRSYLEVTVDEQEIPAVYIGGPVDFYLAGFPTNIYHGIVEYISPVMLETDKKSQYRVRVALEDANIEKGMLIGMSGRACIKANATPLALRLMQKLWFSIEKILFF